MPVRTLADTPVVISSRLYPTGTKSTATVEVIARLQGEFTKLPCAYPYRLRAMEQQQVTALTSFHLMNL